MAIRTPNFNVAPDSVLEQSCTPWPRVSVGNVGTVNTHLPREDVMVGNIYNLF